MRPFHQGDLDSLCGIYCVVNAVRLAAHPGLKIGESQSKGLIDHLVRAIGPKFVQVFADGTDDIPLLLRAASQWLKQAYGRKLVVVRPFRQKSQPSPGLIGSTIAAHLDSPHTAVIISSTVHWSVVDRVTLKRLLLFDSSYHHFIPLEGQAPRTNPDKLVLAH